MASGKVPTPSLSKEPDIILNVTRYKGKLPHYIENSLQQTIVENLGWSLDDLKQLEDGQADGFSQWNCKLIQSSLAKLHTSVLQLILVQQGHMYSDLKKKIAKAKLRIREIDANIDEQDHESFMDVMTIFAEQLAGIAGIAFAFASTPILPAVGPAVAAFAATGFTLRDYVKTVDQKDQYKKKRDEIAREIQKLEKELQKDLWQDYIQQPQMRR